MRIAYASLVREESPDRSLTVDNHRSTLNLSRQKNLRSLRRSWNSEHAPPAPQFRSILWAIDPSPSSVHVSVAYRNTVTPRSRHIFVVHLHVTALLIHLHKHAITILYM